jgi:CheY-like chemotaxis protein
MLMDNLSLLVVEDNQGDLLLIREYLSEKQTCCVPPDNCRNPSNQPWILARHDFDVVLLDLSLPDSFGLDTVRQVIRIFPILP